MNKKKFGKLIKEAQDEFEGEKDNRVKRKIKELMQEYEMAKATVAKIEKQFDKLKKEGHIESTFLLTYDDE